MNTSTIIRTAASFWWYISLTISLFWQRRIPRRSYPYVPLIWWHICLFFSCMSGREIEDKWNDSDFTLEVFCILWLTTQTVMRTWYHPALIMLTAIDLLCGPLYPGSSEHRTRRSIAVDAFIHSRRHESAGFVQARKASLRSNVLRPQRLNKQISFQWSQYHRE